MAHDHDVYSKILALIEPFNTKNITVTPHTLFATDLGFDSLTVMDFVAAVEDTYDIILPLNMLPDLETVDHLVKAVTRIIMEKTRG